MEQEIWKDVVGYEGLYEVSDMGRVRSLNYRGTREVKVMKGGLNNGGYLLLGLKKAGTQRTFTIHSLVTKAFIDKDYRKKGLVVNHKDFNRQNNILSNLEIVTSRKNGNLMHFPSSSKYVGVCWSIKDKLWISRIVVNKSRKYLGCFKTEREASEYYEAALACIDDGRVGDIVVKRREPKGYSFKKASNKWYVRVFENGRHKHLGSFKTEKEAQKAYLDYKFKENN